MPTMRDLKYLDDISYPMFYHGWNFVSERDDQGFFVFSKYA